MNHPFVRWLLDLEVIPPDAERLRLVWEHPWPAWVWVVLLLTGGFLAGWSYSRLLGPRRGRILLATVRFLLVALVLLLISGPILEMPRETIEQDWVLVLVDRSASMSIKDVDRPGGRDSRDEQLHALLTGHEQTWRGLAATRQVVWLGFHDGVFELAAPAAPPDDQSPWAPVELETPTGRRTRISAALDQALRRAAARALSGVILFSDGRTTDPPSRAVVRRLLSDQVGVYPVLLGSRTPLGDLAIRRVEAPRRAFVRDKVPVVVELDQLGSRVAAATGVVKLIDETSGEELDRVELPADADFSQLTLTAEPMLAGEVTWRVEVLAGPMRLSIQAGDSIWL